MQSLFDPPAIVKPTPAPVNIPHAPTDGFTAGYLYDSPQGRTREEIDLHVRGVDGKGGVCPTLASTATDKALRDLVGMGLVTLQDGIYRHTRAKQ